MTASDQLQPVLPLAAEPAEGESQQMLKATDRRRLSNLVQQQLEEGPEVRPFPATVNRLLAACQDGNATATDFEKIIECDAALAVRLLRMANSALFGLTSEVRTIGHATSVLGIRRLKNLALSIAGARMFAEGPTAAKQRQDLWSHSLGCGTIARLLAKTAYAVCPDDIFLAGVFHDVGKLLLYDVVPDEYSELVGSLSGEQLTSEERFNFGISHEEIGLKSAHAWGLSEQIKVAIGFHHRSGETPVHVEFAAVIQLADFLAKTWGVGSPLTEEPDLPWPNVELPPLGDELLGNLEGQARQLFEEAAKMCAAD